jgi:hypothetical protein
LAVELAGLSLIDQVVVAGIAVVLPLALGGAWWQWAGAAAATAIALPMERGSGAAVLVLPLVATTVGRVVAMVRRAGPLMFWTRADGIGVLAAVYACVAAGALVQSRLGVRLFAIREPIVELTAVHYIYAGCGALVLAVGRWAVVCTALAPPIVALGFVVERPLPQVGGAVLLTVGVCLTAASEIREALGHRQGGGLGRLLLGVSGVAVWLPMVLAVAWAAGQYWDVPFLSIPDMARLHGLPNALAFVIAGLVARRMEREVPGWRSAG